MAIIKTPHAAVKIWNYIDRITDTGANPALANQIKEEIVSTISLVGIQTNKVKGDPVGSFNLILAPTRNWVSVITPGSWCVIMMSNEPLTKKSFEKADPLMVKMFGRIDSVRVDVSVDDEGARQTRYLVSGQDWGSMFNNSFYIDPLVSDPSDAMNHQGNALYLQIIKHVLGHDNTPTTFDIPGNLQTLLSVFGKPLQLPDSNRIAKPTHNVAIPDKVLDFFGFIDAKGSKAKSVDLTQIIALQTGALNTSEGQYDTKVKDGLGWLDPFSMVGSHTLWSILMDNCNYALNELYSDMRWINGSPQLTLYNRIKPFSFQKQAVPNIDHDLRAKFQNVVTHILESGTITSVNAGTNWKDKYNFIEIKPEMTEFKIFDVAVKQKSQAYQKVNSAGLAASDIFDREGFRPLIYSIKQIPMNPDNKTADKFDVELLNKWVNLLQEWYFDTHRLLNGRLTMTGVSEYIPVGDNILFEAELVGVTPNYNSSTIKSKNKCFVLAHVESVQHNFATASDGARQFQTTIQFVRGIIVDEQKNLIGEGTIDSLSTDLQKSDSLNSKTVVAPNE